MAMNLSHNEVSYDLSRLLPVGDSTSITFKNFRKTFGANDNVYLVSTEDSAFYEIENFQKFYNFTEDLVKDPAVDSIFSLANFGYLAKDKATHSFVLKKPFNEGPKTQEELDSAISILKDQPFYEGLLYLDGGNVSLMAISFNADSLMTVRRNNFVLNVEQKVRDLEKETGITFKHSGMPYIRANLSSQVKDEILLFISLAFILTALLLYFFLRAPRAVLVSLLVVALAVIWLFGTLGFLNRMSEWGLTGSLNFNMNVLTSLVPPLVIVIGIPNCIFLINKYFDEYRLHKNQALALKRVIQKIGGATFMTNVTTASGFATFVFASSDILIEFGIVASISIMGVFVLSILLLPIIYSYLSPPQEKHYKHLDYKWTNALIEWFVNVCTNYRATVYLVLIFLAGIAGFGLSQLDNDALVVDDIPAEHPVMVDLKYYETKFNGVIPFEILINSGGGKRITFTTDQKVDEAAVKALPFVSSINYLEEDTMYLLTSTNTPNAEESLTEYFEDNGTTIKIINAEKLRGKALRLKTLKKVQRLYDLLATYDEFSRPFSMLDVIKYSKQAYYNGNPNEYAMPLKLELSGISTYASQSKDASSDMLKSFLSSDKSQLRISLQMKDVGTNRTKALIAELTPKIDKIFNSEKDSFAFTGIGVIVAKGVETLISNLVMSLALTIMIISILMGFMFRNIRMVLISLLPNLLPLFITAAIMGYFGINLKPSTILVFSIAFGISIDDTIHFLVKYRQELNANNGKIRKSVLKALRETGLSMFYTSVVLFFGFGIFVASEFGGTVALGILVALTLLVAMLSNLILLPCLLLTLDKLITIKAAKNS